MSGARCRLAAEIIIPYASVGMGAYGGGSGSGSSEFSVAEGSLA
jgi:hypothetical protein